MSADHLEARERGRQALLEEWANTPSNGIDPATWWQRKAFELAEKLSLKDDLLRAYRTGDHKLADRTLAKLEKSRG